MSETIGVLRYEYVMQIRRIGLWVSSAILVGLIYFFVAKDLTQQPKELLDNPWELAINLVAPLNIFAPVAAGILVADRFPRDFRLGVNDVLRTALSSARPLVTGKYLGSLLAVLTPVLLLMLAMLIYLALRLQMGALFWMVPLVTMGTVVPAWLFFVAWSLVFPLALPLRLYQVLFAGFWLWAVAVPPARLPTINQSILGLQGDYADHAFFGDTGVMYANFHPPATPGWAVVNMGLIVGLSLVALFLTPAVLRWREERA
jgi:ABC-type transport system involved in multi-copper enzyme maturation permease subunit